MNRLQRTYFAGISAALSLAATLALSGCGEDYLFSDSSVPSLGQHIFVLPDRLTGQPFTYTTPVTTVYLDTNESVKFWAAYSLDGAYIATDTSDNHYLDHSWTIDGEEYNISPLRFSFAEPGYHQGILQTVDLMGDTLVDTLDIFVNTPLSIRAVAPVNGYNMASPESDAEVNLAWDIAGLDTWESATCHVFASDDPEEIWRSNLGQVDCSQDVKLTGPFVKDSLYKAIAAGKANDTTVTIYWGIKAYVTAEGGFRERDSTEVFQFTTHFIRTDSAIIDIPVVYRGMREGNNYLNVAVLNAQGDTLDFLESRNFAVTLHTTVAAQTGIRIVPIERRKTEFDAEEVTINVLPGTRTIIDTIEFIDKIQPQVALRSGVNIDSTIIDTKPFEKDSIIFFALDNGSGINPNKIVVVSDHDTLSHVYNEPFIKFPNTCKRTCKLRVSVEDYAHNTSPKFYWSVTMEGNTPVFSGPFSELGGEQ